MNRPDGLVVGCRVRFRRPGSRSWREGTFKRWSYSRSGRMLVQVTVDRVDGGVLRPPVTARVRPDRIEVLGVSDDV